MKVAAVPDELAEDLSTPAGAGSASSASLSAPPSTGQRPNATVDAIVVVHNGATWLAQCLDGLAAQTLPPARLVIVDVASSDTSNAIARAHTGVRRAIESVEVVRLDARVPIGRAIERGIEALPVPADASSSWVWVLHDDTVPRGQRRSPSCSRPGCGPSPSGSPGPSSSTGTTRGGSSRWASRSPARDAGSRSPVRGEADQGQYDTARTSSP